MREFEFVTKLLHDLVNDICESVMADEPPVLYLTAGEGMIEKLNRRNRFLKEEPLVYKPNFREAIAVTKPYKGSRSGKRPFYYDALTMYMIENFDVRISNGIEADDLMSIDQMKDLDNSVICSRDKDLRVTKGWHYGWACGKQPEFPMEYVEDLGWIKCNDAKKKLDGVGMKFFYSQMITGDTVDNIPGIAGKGYKAAYKALCDAETVDECKSIVVGMYKDKYADKAREYFTEQAQLLWMLRRYDSEDDLIGGWNV